MKEATQEYLDLCASKIREGKNANGHWARFDNDRLRNKTGHGRARKAKNKAARKSRLRNR